MSEQQFLAAPLHTAYAGLMPPELPARRPSIWHPNWPESSHGQSINGYEVLERAGLLKTIGVEPGVTVLFIAWLADSITLTANGQQLTAKQGI